MDLFAVAGVLSTVDVEEDVWFDCFPFVFAVPLVLLGPVFRCCPVRGDDDDDDEVDDNDDVLVWFDINVSVGYELVNANRSNESI